MRELAAPSLTSSEFAVSDIPSMRERIVVSPATGRFEPLPPEVFTTEGEWVEYGQVLARIRAGASVVPVSASFRGWMMGALALPGQPVRAGEALFWGWRC